MTRRAQWEGNVARPLRAPAWERLADVKTWEHVAHTVMDLEAQIASAEAYNTERLAFIRELKACVLNPEEWEAKYGFSQKRTAELVAELRALNLDAFKARLMVDDAKQKLAEAGHRIGVLGRLL